MDHELVEKGIVSDQGEVDHLGIETDLVHGRIELDVAAQQVPNPPEITRPVMNELG